MYGSARKPYLQMLDPVHGQGLRLCCGSFTTSSVESLYVDAHETSSYLCLFTYLLHRSLALDVLNFFCILGVMA